MAGYGLLGDVDDIRQAHSIEVLLAPSSDFKVKSFKASAEAEAQSFKYYQDGQIAVITSPMQSNYLPLFLDNVAQSEAFQNKDILVVLHGMGATEAHYVTAHICPNRTIKIIDSKVSDPKRFFSANPGNKLLAAIKGLFLAIRTGSKTLNTLILDRAVEYIPLGTQSYFDGVSCGFHAVSNLNVCKQLIKNTDQINRKEILKAQERSVQTVSSGLIGHPHYKNRVDSRFISFITTAWQETWMPLVPKDERNQRSFRHYFLGWPYKGAFQRTLYVLTLGFILQPVINLLKIPFMLLPRVLAETMHWVRDRAIDWTPKTYLFQSLRSLFMLCTYPLEGFLKAIPMLLGLVLDPKTSIQLSYRIHPALGVLTGFVIAGIYLTFAFVALPAIWNALSPLAVSLIKPSIILLAEPIMLLHAGIPTIMAAACSILFSVVSLLGIQWVLEKIASWVDSGKSDMQQTRLAPQYEDSNEEKRGSSPYDHPNLIDSKGRSSELRDTQEFQPSGTLDLRKRNTTESTPLYHKRVSKGLDI